jgi:tRNA(Arg) A34 adenosine deaminase TadA
MCASACIWAKFEGVVYGANIEDRNDNYTQRILIRCRDVFKNGTPKIELYEDFMRDECLPLLLL